MTRLALGVSALFTLGCTGFGVLVYDQDDTFTDTGTIPTFPTTPYGTYPTDSAAPPPPDDLFPARYLGIRGQFAYNRPNNKVMAASLYGESYPPKISIELYTERFMVTGMDYSDTAEYCTIDLLLRPGNPLPSYAAQVDPTAYTAFAHSGSPAETSSTCGDAQHPIDGLFYGSPVEAVLSPGQPWSVGVGDSPFEDDGTGQAGGRIYNSTEFTGGALTDDAYFVVAYPIDPNTGEITIGDQGYPTELLGSEMWNGTKLASAVYFVTGVTVLDLGSEF